MQLVVARDGVVHCVYAEDIDLSVIGHLSLRRASHVEPDQRGQWYADLAPVNGPKLGPFAKRSQALEAEAAWLDGQWPVYAPSSKALARPRMSSTFIGMVQSEDRRGKRCEVGRFQVTALTRKEAEQRAIEQLWDARLDAAGLAPIVVFFRGELDSLARDVDEDISGGRP